MKTIFANTYEIAYYLRVARGAQFQVGRLTRGVSPRRRSCTVSCRLVSPVSILYFPSEAADVDDDSQAPKLVVLHYDAANVKAIEAATPPDLVLKLFEHKGSMEEYRKE